MPDRALAAFVLATLLAAGACRPPDAGRSDPVAPGYLRLVAAEDARPAGGPALDALLAGTRAGPSALRAAAVRGLGRLERPEHVGAIAPLLGDDDRSVRREAANALAQAVHRGDGTAALAPLLAAAGREADPTVLGAIARSLGRLDVDAAARRRVALTLVALSRGEHGADAPPYQMEGVVLGMASLVRSLSGSAPPSALAARLEDLTGYGLTAPEGDAGAVRVRAVAVLAHTAGSPAPGTLERLLGDPAPDVRRIAASRLATSPPADRARLARIAVGDADAPVRLEGVRRGLAVPPLDGEACALLVGVAAGDPDPHVRLAAIDALANPCPDRNAQAERLASWAAELDADPASWHAGAHALAALGSLAPGRAVALVRSSARHADPFARAWVAVAAARAGDLATLRTLAGDPSPNVRTAAVRGLSALEGRGADGDLLAVLGEADDPQLLMTTAELLGGTASPEAAGTALQALERASAARSLTNRDARTALLDLIESVGDTTRVRDVEPYLRDYDDAVALRAANVLRAWTGQRWIDAPRGTPPMPPPSVDELAAMERATLVFHMARGGAFELSLLPWQAPTNAVRLYRLALAGALDGLTFHRVADNFVIQGGSPGANEYAGHGAYTRDEVGLVPNWRGTVGVSTRGRDTGDGQIYVNLVDNVRLDHDYTILGVVRAGLDVVGQVLEGDRITSVEVRR